SPKKVSGKLFLAGCWGMRMAGGSVWFIFKWVRTPRVLPTSPESAPARSGFDEQSAGFKANRMDGHKLMRLFAARARGVLSECGSGVAQRERITGINSGPA